MHQQKIVAADGGNHGRNKMEDRYLKYRHYYVGIDMSGFGGYGKAVYSPLLPFFDQWYKRKALKDVLPNITLLEDRLYLVEHPDYREERGGAISFHIKVLALSMIGLIMNHHKDEITMRILDAIVFDISRYTKSYDYSECLCFSITVKMFVDMLKEDFAHLGTSLDDLSFRDFANEETLAPKPQPVLGIL